MNFLKLKSLIPLAFLGESSIVLSDANDANRRLGSFQLGAEGLS